MIALNMKDKYYIPTIEDFRQGFEYECETTMYPDKNNWHPQIFNFTETQLSLVKAYHPVDKIRVKILTLDDILVLGGLNDLTRHKALDLNQDIDDECHFISGKTFRGASAGDDKKLHIYYNPERNTMQIWYRSNNGYETTLFDGIINNTSEFKVLLLQLNIKLDY